eukprot:6203133-Pleurochrysis_carterae.AAC.2
MRVHIMPGSAAVLRPWPRLLICSMSLLGPNGFYDGLASELLAKAGDSQYWVAIAGGPGSGKSTLSAGLADALGQNGVVLPMDGFHYYKSELDQFEDPDYAHARRGASFTFDGLKYRERIQKLHESGEGTWPSFDHTVGDPIEADIRLDKGNRVVLVEGNYLLLDESPWREARIYFNEMWFVDTPVEIARDRVAIRNAAAWNWPLERAYKRTDENDVVNMRIVADTKVFATRVLRSEDIPLPDCAEGVADEKQTA